jgi:hypothetical protein
MGAWEDKWEDGPNNDRVEVNGVSDYNHSRGSESPKVPMDKAFSPRKAYDVSGDSLPVDMKGLPQDPEVNYPDPKP